MILDDMEENPDKYEGKKLSELIDNEDFDEQSSVEYTEVYYKNNLLPKIILVSTSLFIFFLIFFMHSCDVAMYVGRKQVLKNLIWKLPLLNGRLTIPLTFIAHVLIT